MINPYSTFWESELFTLVFFARLITHLRFGIGVRLKSYNEFKKILNYILKLS